MRLLAGSLTLVLTLSSGGPVAGSAAPEQRRGQSSQGDDQLRRQINEERADPNPAETFRLRARALAEAGLPPVGRPEVVYGPNEALEDLWALATEIQGLYDLRRASGLNSDAIKEIENRSKKSIDPASRVLDFIGGGADAPLADPDPLPMGNFQERVERLMDSFRELIDPTIRLIAGDVLDLAVLGQVQTGFATMEALLQALPESSLAAETP